VKIYNRHTVDLGSVLGSRFTGILSPVYDDKTIRNYITSQFREHAESYAKAYTNIDYWNSLITIAISCSGLNEKRDDNLMILDIGSGAGNTILPLITLFPNSDIIASDLSVDLLALLKEYIDKHLHFEHNKLLLFQLNAEELDFKPSTFDIVVGGSILHHLLSPEKAISGVHDVLKPGGCAIFFEPFEAGNVILELAYSEIISSFPGYSHSLPNETRAFLKAMIEDYRVRKGRDKSLEVYKQLDDKWLFTKSYFNELYERYNFSKMVIYPIHDTKQQFEYQTITNLRLGLGKGINALPEGAWNIIRKYDRVFSEDLKQELIIEACVIFVK